MKQESERVQATIVWAVFSLKHYFGPFIKLYVSASRK